MIPQSFVPNLASIEAVLGVRLEQARQALESLDHEALVALGLGSGADAPPLPMRAVPKKPRIRDIAQRDRLHMAPAAKKVLEEASRPNRRRLQVTAQQVLAQILTLQPPDPAAVLDVYKRQPMGVVASGSTVWVANQYGNTVTELNAADGSLLRLSLIHILIRLRPPNGWCQRPDTTWPTSTISDWRIRPWQHYVGHH